MEHQMESVWLDLGFLRQDFWAHHMISISNLRESLPHSLHTQELPFYWPNKGINKYFVGNISNKSNFIC